MILAVLVVVVSLSPLLPSLSEPSVSDPVGFTTSSSFCTGFYSIAAPHIALSASACQAAFEVIAASGFDKLNPIDPVYLSFAIPAIAEIDASGNLVRAAFPSHPNIGWVNQTRWAGGDNVSGEWVMDVANASGVWSPNESSNWSIGTGTVGSAIASVVFHITNTSGNASLNDSSLVSFGIKFDFNILSWPWESSLDSLGMSLSAAESKGSHFVYQAANDSLVEFDNASGRALVRLTFGPNATISPVSGGNGSASTETQVGVYPDATNSQSALALVEFVGVAGGYSTLHYDPRVILSISIPAIGFSVWYWYAIATMGGVAIGSLALVSLQRSTRRQAEQLVDDMRRIMRPPKV